VESNSGPPRKYFPLLKRAGVLPGTGNDLERTGNAVDALANRSEKYPKIHNQTLTISKKATMKKIININFHSRVIRLKNGL